MSKYIGFDIDSKKTIACVVQKGKKDKYTTLKADIGQMKKFLQKQRQNGEKLHLTFEISGEAGYRYDSLIDSVDDITVSNPTKMTWIYRTAKKNDRIDARKQAVCFCFGRCASDFFIPRHYSQNRQHHNSLFHPLDNFIWEIRVYYCLLTIYD